MVANNVLGMYNNAFAYNTTSLPGGTGGPYVYVGAATGFVNRNIFLGNSNCGVFINSANVRLDLNDFGSRCGTTPLTEIDNLNLAPQFVDVAGDDFHLASNSPLIGTIDAYVTEIDPDGHQGPGHGVSDRGAYFETIFADGTDAN